MAKEVHIILLLLFVKTNIYLADDSNPSNNQLNKEDDDHKIRLAAENKLKSFSSFLKCTDCHDQKKDLIRNDYDEDKEHSAELSSNRNYDLRNLRSSYKELKRRHNITSNATNRQMMIKPFSGSIVGDIKHKWRNEDKEEEGKKVKNDDEEKSTHSKRKKSKKEKDEVEEKNYENEDKIEHREHKDAHEEHGEEEHGSFHKTDDDAESFHKSHDDSEPFHKSHDDHEQFHKSHDDHEPFHKSYDDHELFHKSHEDHEPFHKSHQDHESFHKSHEDNEPYHKSHQNHEPFHKSHEDHELYHKPHEDHEHFQKSQEEQFHDSHEGHKSFHKSHEPVHYNGQEVDKKEEDDWPLHDMDKDQNFKNEIHEKLKEDDEKLKEEDEKLKEEDEKEFNDHGGGFDEDEEDDGFGKDHYDLDKDMDFPREDDEYRKHHHRNQKSHRNGEERHNNNLPHFSQNNKNDLLAPKDVNYLNHGMDPLFSLPSNEEKVSIEGINRDMDFNKDNRYEGDQNIYNPVQSFVEKSQKPNAANNDYLNNPGESIGRRIEREEGISQFARNYDVQKSKVESAKKDPYSSIEDLKVDDDEGPDDAPTKNKKHLPDELAWNKDMPYKDLKNKNQAHRRHHFNEFSPFSSFPKFGELGRGKNKKHRNRRKGNEREKISNHPDEYDSHGHIKGEIRNYDDEYDDEEDHKKESRYKAIERPHDGIEKFGKDDEEVIINDRTHQGDINEVEIVKQLTDSKTALTRGARRHHQSFDKSEKFHEPKEYGGKTSHGLLGNSAKDGGGEFYENNPNVYPHEFNNFNRPYSNQNIQIGQYGKRRYNPFDTIIGGGFNGETTFKSFDQAEDIFKKMRAVVKETPLAPNEIKEHADIRIRRFSIGKPEYEKRNTLKKIESRLKKIQEKIFIKSAFQKQMKKKFK